MRKYGVIYADPAWWYNKRGNPQTRFGVGSWRYGLMRDDEIFKMGDWVSAIAAEDCALFLWSTCPRLPTALMTMVRWGFTYVTVAFSWIKINSRVGNLVSGPGHYTASNLELCLLGRRGSVLPTGKKGSANKQIILEIDGYREVLMPGAAEDGSDLVIAPRRDHSRKPDVVRLRIEAMYPDADRIELFCRHPAPGWDVWGEGVGLVEPLADQTQPTDDELGYLQDMAELLGVRKGKLTAQREEGDREPPKPPWAE